MNWTLDAQNWLVIFTAFAAMSYGYWLIGEAERQRAKRQ